MITSKFGFSTYLWSPKPELIKSIKKLERQERFWKYSIIAKSIARKKGLGDKFWFNEAKKKEKKVLAENINFNLAELSNFQIYVSGAIRELELFQKEANHYSKEQDNQVNALTDILAELRDSYPTLSQLFANNKEAQYRFDIMLKETLSGEIKSLTELQIDQGKNVINSITKRTEYFSEILRNLTEISEFNIKHKKNLDEQSLSKLVKELGRDYSKQVKLGKSVHKLINKIYKLSDFEKKESEKLNREYKNIIQNLRRIKDDVYTIISITYLGPDYPEKLKEKGDKEFINELKKLPCFPSKNPEKNIGTFLQKNFNFISVLDKFGKLRNTATHSTAGLYIYPNLPDGQALINVGIIVQAFDIHDNLIDGIGDDLNNSLNAIIIQYINSLLQLGELIKSFPPHTKLPSPKTASEKL